LAKLLEELAARDPQSFARMDRKNARRVVRAIEVLRLTGRPAHELRTTWTPATGRPAAPRFYALRRTAPDLGRRIDARVAAMFAQGLVEETRWLLESGLAANRTAMQAIGYRQVVEHLQGVRGLAETIALVQQRTRQFARRQMTWLRRQLPVTWIDVAADEPVERVAQRICL
jgi:tRNA dimethylallyltransferase